MILPELSLPRPCGAASTFILLGTFCTEGPPPSIVETETIRSEFCVWECLQMNEGSGCTYDYLELRCENTSSCLHIYTRSSHWYLISGFLSPSSTPWQMPFFLSGSPAYFSTSNQVPFLPYNFVFSLLSLLQIRQHHSLIYQHWLPKRTQLIWPGLHFFSVPGFFYNQMIPYRSWHQWKLMWVSTLAMPQMLWDMTPSPLLSH